jgi:hypothetical protein
VANTNKYKQPVATQLKGYSMFLIVLLLLLVSFLPAMWNEAISYSSESSSMLSNYPEVAKWLAANMKPNECALVPFPDVFTSIEPELKQRFIGYSALWQYSGNYVAADNTFQEILSVRNSLIEFATLENIKFIVVGPNDLQSAKLFENTQNDNLTLHMFSLATFHSLGPLWNEGLSVYRFNSNVEEKLRIIPSSNALLINSQGNTTFCFKSGQLEINYTGDARVYIPFNFSSSDLQNIQFFASMKNSSGKGGDIVLYFDKNGDGIWSGWDVDQGITLSFNSPSEGQDASILQSFSKIENNLVQIGFILNSPTPATLTVTNLSFYQTIGWN